MLGDQDLTSLLDGECPDCGGTRFLQGPQGGLADNIECARCHSRFNFCPHCPMLPDGFAERITNAP